MRVSGRTIIKTRRRLKMTRMELAEKAKVGHVTLWRWERERGKNPELDVLARVAGALGVEISELLVNSGSPASPYPAGRSRRGNP